MQSELSDSPGLRYPVKWDFKFAIESQTDKGKILSRCLLNSKICSEKMLNKMHLNENFEIKIY